MEILQIDRSRFGGNYIYPKPYRRDVQNIPPAERQPFTHKDIKVKPVAAFLWDVEDIGTYTESKLAVAAIDQHLKQKEDKKNARKKKRYERPDIVPFRGC
jgi:hypothetical protein